MINVVYAFFETFAIVDAATHGGPGQDTSILVYKVYYDGFKAMDINGSAAQSAVLMVDRRCPDRYPVQVRREKSELLSMIQRNPILDFFSHLILILGVVIVFFPIYVTFIGSTQTAQQISVQQSDLAAARQQFRGELPVRAVWRQDRGRRFGGTGRCR